MPMTCTICRHPEREAIDAALVAGESLRDIAGRTGTSRSALARHKAEHLPASLALAKDAEEVAHGDGLLARLRGLESDAARIGRKAERVSDFSAALAAIREQTRLITLLLEVAGELQRGATVSILVESPEWVTVRGVLVAALIPYPDARNAVLEALEHVSA